VKLWRQVVEVWVPALVAVPLGVLSWLAPLYPYGWETDALYARKPDADSSAFIVYSASFSLALASVALLTSRRIRSRTGSGLRLALVALAVANSWRLIQALPGFQG
jgi:hypothetical protein